MLRAKAAKYKRGEVTLRNKVLSNTDALGRIAGNPIVTQTVNAVNRAKPVRGAMESVLGVERHAWLPGFAPRKFRSAAQASPDVAVRDGERTPGKVAIYATCYVNFNEPDIGHDLLALLVHNEVVLLFEDELTIRYQIQKTLNIKKSFDEEGIQAELDAYLPLVPDGCNLKEMMQIEYENEIERHAALRRLIGIERHVFLQASVYAISEEDLERENDEKTSAVIFCASSSRSG
jgi:hypothetical protein